MRALPSEASPTPIMSHWIAHRDLRHPIAPVNNARSSVAASHFNWADPSGATTIRESQAMSLADRLTRQLKQSREFCEKLFEAFKSPEDWTHQIAPGTNHALWFAGHMATADNFFIGMIDPNKKRDLDDWGKHFGMGSNRHPIPTTILPWRKSSTRCASAAPRCSKSSV